MNGSTGVPAARKFIRPQLADNPTLFLSAQDMGRMAGPPEIWNNDVRRLQNRAFVSFKTGS